MRNWKKWHAEKKARSARASRAATARWARFHASQAGNPALQTRVVEFPIRDTHRPGTTLRLVAEPTASGWSRWILFQDGQRVGKRRLGATAVAKLIARLLK